MTDNMANFQRKLMGDGPAERQILLLKLIHEFETAPAFGAEFIADADSQAQRWIARIEALLSRLSIQHEINVQSISRTNAMYWKAARESYRRALSKAVEEIKLELELDGREEIGTVYEAGKEYDFFTDLKAIIGAASSDIFIVDAYFDGASFEAYLGAVESNVSIRILCSSYAKDVSAYAAKYEAQTQATVQLRKAKSIHDRAVFVDGTDCWVVGASIKDAGKKPTYLLPLMPQLAPQKLKIYADIWDASPLITSP